jgi:DNA-binding CsgD family transcriptional regulator/tetratricopeptide (TPR) repeat protein
MGTLSRYDQMLSLVEALRSRLATAELDRGNEADLRFQLARALVVSGDYEAAQPELTGVVQQLPRHSHDRVWSMIFLGMPVGPVQPAAVHLRWLREAQEALPFVPGERLHLQVDRITALLLLGEQSGWEEAGRFPQEATTRHMRRDVCAGQGNIGDCARVWGRYAEARRRASLAIELAERYEFHALRDQGIVTLAHLDWLTGHWDGLAERVTPIADDEQLRLTTQIQASFVLGLRCAAVGDTAEAERRLQASYDMGRENGAIHEFAEQAAALAQLWLAGGRTADALRITAEAAEITMGKGIWVCGLEVVPIRVELLAAAGRAGEAAELAGAFAQLVDGRDAPAARAAVASCEAILATDPDQAAALYDLAAAAWQSLPRPYDALLARERQGGKLLAAGHTSAGCTVLTDVFAGLSGLGARAAAVRVMTTLRRHGIEVRPPWRGGSRGYGDELSPREMDVVRLVVDGRSNRQIAEALVLSHKTVARHVDAAMRKLGVRSRTALAVKAVQAGICSPAGGDGDSRLGHLTNR